MGERYVITGAQLGMLISVREVKARQNIVDDIIDKQFICNLENNQMKNFEKEINLLGEKFIKKEEEE
jgi:hypothetical protein